VRKLGIAVLLAVVAWTGIRWGTFVAGGSDSYCYVHQAERWAALLQGEGGLQAVEPLALEAPWPEAEATFTPIGHQPSRTMPGAIVPICPSGLSILMAPFLVLGGRDAIFLVVPLLGALLVGATYVLGSRFGTRVGVGSALLAAASPVFLYQLVQPMSDVPASAFWVLAVAAVSGTKPRAPVIGGLATAAAVLMRPNLVPMAIPIGLFLLLRPERTWRERVRAAATYAACAVPGAIVVALIQQGFYGSPLSSGYGSLDALFGVENVGPNATRYFGWMSQAHTPAWLLAVAAPFLLPGALTGLLVSVTLVNLALYLPYTMFSEWWYLRFLLPTIPLVLVLALASFDAIWRRTVKVRPTSVRMGGAAVVVPLAAALMAALFVVEARRLAVFELQQFEARFEQAGTYVAERLPENALVLTAWQSGSVRFYSGRRTLAWEALDPAWLDRALAFAVEHELEPYLLFETREEPLFRQRFAGSSLGALDWPPLADVASQVRIYRPGDRELYLKGQQPPTEYVR
jgi:hypothetical protein